MRNDDDFLSDLESDIDGDWQDIRKKILKKQEEQHTLNNPQRIMMPKYKQFYEILYKIFRSWDGKELHPFALNDLHVLIRGIFYNHSGCPMPVAFERVWEIFCNPREFKCDSGVRCNNCKQRWDVLHKVEKVVIRAVPPWEDEYYEQAMELKLKQAMVNCPSCGYNILILRNTTLVGVFGHIHVNEKEEYKKRKEKRKDMFNEVFDFGF